MADFRGIPSIDRLLRAEGVKALREHYGYPALLEVLREVQEGLPLRLGRGEALPGDGELIEEARGMLEKQNKPSLQSVINATGVLLHTNLGRAPLSVEALEAIADLGAGYCSLEYELEGGKRGKRDLHASDLLVKLSGAEAALVVNNNAGAVLLALSALARGQKVAISRAQMIEVGGGFRIPDVMRQSGAKLLEVGSTNRTHLGDYAEAIEAGAAAVLVAHPSNFRIEGFTAQVPLGELASLVHAHSLPLILDLGSGTFLDTARYGLAHEPTVQECLQAGADLICISGDKLLGGPQAGILLGKSVLLDKIRKHPLYRALRADKICLAALSVTLRHYLKDEAEEKIPLYRMMARKSEDLHVQVQRWQAELLCGELQFGFSTVGGGSLPGEVLPTSLLVLKPSSPRKFVSLLRAQDPPIIARIQDDCVLLDPRSVLPAQEADLLKGLKNVIAQQKGI